MFIFLSIMFSASLIVATFVTIVTLAEQGESAVPTWCWLSLLVWLFILFNHGRSITSTEHKHNVNIVENKAIIVVDDEIVDLNRCFDHNFKPDDVITVTKYSGRSLFGLITGSLTERKLEINE